MCEFNRKPNDINAYVEELFLMQEKVKFELHKVEQIVDRLYNEVSEESLERLNDIQYDLFKIVKTLRNNKIPFYVNQYNQFSKMLNSYQEKYKNNDIDDFFNDLNYYNNFFKKFILPNGYDWMDIQKGDVYDVMIMDACEKYDPNKKYHVSSVEDLGCYYTNTEGNKEVVVKGLVHIEETEIKEFIEDSKNRIIMNKTQFVHEIQLFENKKIIIPLNTDLPYYGVLNSNFQRDRKCDFSQHQRVYWKAIDKDKKLLIHTMITYNSKAKIEKIEIDEAEEIGRIYFSNNTTQCIQLKEKENDESEL